GHGIQDHLFIVDDQNPASWQLAKTVDRDIAAALFDRGGRQQQPKERPFADSALHFQLSAEGLHDSMTDGEAQADSCSERLCGEKGLEDPFENLRRDPASGIAYFDNHPSPTVGSRA